MKFYKILQCSCVDGFTGDFCEFKTEQDTLLFVNRYDQFVFAANGRLIQDYTAIDLTATAPACSTMLNGEAIIFGGYSGFWGAADYSITSVRQVLSKINRQRMEISLILDNGGC